jgi:hypothetical protein
VRKLKYQRRENQAGRNQMNVCVYFEDGGTWKIWTDKNQNPHLPELRRTVASALETLDGYIARGDR